MTGIKRIAVYAALAAVILISSVLAVYFLNSGENSVKISAEAETAEVGDTYSDGIINSKDAIYILQYLSGIVSSSDINLVSANTYVEDNSDDGTIKINSKDAVILLQYLAKMDVTLGVGEWYVKTAPTESSTGTLARKVASGIETVTLPVFNTDNYTRIGAKEATCTQDGYINYYCSIDGQNYTYTVTVEKLGHTIVTDEAVAATCTTTGLTEGSHCSVCGEVFEAQTIINAKGHTTVTTKEGASPTCTESGLTEELTCTTCGAIVQEQTVIAATGHADSNNDYICDNCGELSLDESECTLISSITDMENIISDMSGYYILTCDLNLSGYSWSPIGSTSLPFTGLLYGNGHVINGLSFDSTSDCGLFISNAGTIANLTINNFTCNVEGSGSFGGFAVYNSGSIINCSVTGASSFVVTQGMQGSIGMNYNTYSWSHSLGGICAENSGTIENCSVTGTYEITIKCVTNISISVFMGSSSYGITSTINADLGLITGVNSGTIDNCSVSATSAASVIGYAYSYKCKAEANVNAYLGALVGVNKGTVSNSQGKKMTVTTDESTDVGTSGSSYSYTNLNVYEDSTYKGLFGSNTGTISKVTFLG